MRKEQTDRHLFRAEPRRVRYVEGNKFTLDGDAVENTANEAQHSIIQGLYALTVTGCLMQDSFC